MRPTPTLCALLLSAVFASAADGMKPHDSGKPVAFDARTANSGDWSDAQTWEGERMPRAGDFVQVRSGHAVIYDVESGDRLRMVHVAGRPHDAVQRNLIEPGERKVRWRILAGARRRAVRDETPDGGHVRIGQFRDGVCAMGATAVTPP